MTKGYIYKIVNSENDKVYIGQTIRSIHKRFIEHLNCKRDTVLIRAFNKYGRDKFKIIKVCCVIGSKEYVTNKLNKLEMYYIKIYDSRRNGYNMTNGGEDNPMYYQENIDKMKESRGAWDEEHIKMFSESKIGKNNPMYGVEPPNKGKPCPQHVRDAVSKAQKGRKDSPEIIEKRTKHFRENNVNAKRVKVYFNNEFVGEFKSIKNAYDSLNLDVIYDTFRHMVRKSIKENKPYKNYTFEYVK